MEQTRRRQFLLASGAFLVAPRTSFAQPLQGKVPRVGFLISETVTGTSSRIDAMRAGLRDRGYVEGKNIRIELRAADGRYDRLPELAQSLVHDKVDVIVAFGNKAMLAATSATKIIPIVDPVLGDPVASGQAASLARPGGNVTGLSTYGADISLKRLELFKEALPPIGLLAVTINPANPSGMSVFQQLVPAAARLKVELKLFEAREAGDFDAMFAAMAKMRVDSILMSSDTLFRSNDSGLAALAVKYRLPSIGSKEYAEAGGMIGYGVNDAELFRRGADYVDRILKGAKAGDLPFERPTRFELVVNTKTAKALGVRIPESILYRADRVI
jgi:putative ABC transport system substrate-binding protein